ncbi:hypothetical protein K438DRAFT_1938087 [Mycena galopus ATCC 62051]|nr:hypothetical protein K438DRAFT_1938087 [Mycena galopus ATCC 62051]
MVFTLSNYLDGCHSVSSSTFGQTDCLSNMLRKAAAIIPNSDVGSRRMPCSDQTNQDNSGDFLFIVAVLCRGLKLIFPTHIDNICLSQALTLGPESKSLLAKTCFEEDDLYKDTFTATTMAAQKALWNTKIKNHIAIQELGLEVQTNIQKGLPWQPNEIKEDSPWFFEMCKLIASRPNLQPVGLGNNTTDVQTEILLPTNDTAADDAESSAFDTSDAYLDIESNTNSEYRKYSCQAICE